MRVKFKRNFTSPVLGNVWIGREVVVTSEQARKFIALGYAEAVQETAADKLAQVKPPAKKKTVEDLV